MSSTPIWFRAVIFIFLGLTLLLRIPLGISDKFCFHILFPLIFGSLLTVMKSVLIQSICSDCEESLRHQGDENRSVTSYTPMWLRAVIS